MSDEIPPQSESFGLGKLAASENAKGSGEAIALAVAAPTPRYSFASLDGETSRQLEQLCGAVGYSALHFWRQMRAVAVSACGLGLHPTGAETSDAPPIITIIQRWPDIDSLAVLANLLEARENSVAAKPVIHTIAVATDSTAGHAPDLLAHRLETEIERETLPGAFLILNLPSRVVTEEWAHIATGDDANPLKQVLRKAGKRLIIGIEPSDAFPLSQLVNSQTGAFPLSWGVPLLVRRAARNGFRSSQIDFEMIRELDTVSTWDSAHDDRSEYDRAIQFSGLREDFHYAEELNAAIKALLDERDISLKHQWARTEARANDALGLGVHPAHLDAEIVAPVIIKRSLICSAAFARDLPGGLFLSLVRRSLPEHLAISLSDLSAAEREQAVLLAGLQGSEHPVLPPMATTRSYFDAHADRLCRAYHIEIDDLGRMGPGRSWQRFSLARHICQHAPAAAIDYAQRLLDSGPDIRPQARGEMEAVVRVLATLQHNLPSAIDWQKLATWLRDCALGPLTQPANGGAMGPPTGEGIPPLSRNGVAQQAHAIARLILAFLTERRALAATRDLRRGGRDDVSHLLQAVAGQIDNPQITLTLAVYLVLMDEDASPDDHRMLETIVKVGMVELDQMEWLITAVADFFATPVAGHVEARCASASRLIVFFERAACKPSAHPAWRTARDRLLSMLINYDIRWPPPGLNLLDYKYHQRRIGLELVLTASQDTASPTAMIEARDILIARFLARGPARWLEDSWKGWAAQEAPHRLYDTILVLLDGVPETAHHWRNRAFNDTADTILAMLLTACRVRDLRDLSDYERRLRDCGSDPRAKAGAKPSVALYGLYWSAILLFWRFKLFGVAPLSRDDPKADAFRAFLADYCAAADRDVALNVADGLDHLAAALKRAVLHLIYETIDHDAHAFYAAKHQAAERLASVLRKQVSKTPDKPEGPSPAGSTLPIIPSGQSDAADAG